MQLGCHGLIRLWMIVITVSFTTLFFLPPGKAKGANAWEHSQARLCQ